MLKNKMLSFILGAMILLHIVVLSKVLNNEGSVIKKKQVKTLHLKKVILQEPKVVKKKKTNKKIKRFSPIINDIPIEEIEFEEEELDEEIAFDFEIEQTELETYIDSAQVANLKQQYINDIYSEVVKHKYYPKRAKRMGVEGTAEVLFTINKNGSISDVKLSKSSRFRVIDKAAVDAVKKIKIIRPIPDELEMEEWELIIPIKYELT